MAIITQQILYTFKITSFRSIYSKFLSPYFIKAIFDFIFKEILLPIADKISHFVYIYYIFNFKKISDGLWLLLFVNQINRQHFGIDRSISVYNHCDYVNVQFQNLIDRHSIHYSMIKYLFFLFNFECITFSFSLSHFLSFHSFISFILVLNSIIITNKKATEINLSIIQKEMCENLQPKKQ